MDLWRIDSARRAPDAFSGEGAYLYGGRWNRPGTRVIYASGTLALAALEKFVHLGAEAWEMKFVYFKITVPENVAVKTFPGALLPAGWDAVPVPQATMELGSAWAKGAVTAVLKVPSVLVPAESNYLINPAHPDFRKLKVGKPLPFCFDPRMRK